jgi:hypothetical protein
MKLILKFDFTSLKLNLPGRIVEFEHAASVIETLGSKNVLDYACADDCIS